MKKFTESVYVVVKQIPKGRVSTYGQIAVRAGYPRAARAVGNVLHHNPCPDEIPCHRVVNGQGHMAPAFAFGGPDEQAKRLQKEGIRVVENKVNLKKYLWH